jgi:hypothetical protein
VPRHRVGVKALLATLCLCLAGCAPGWQCMNRHFVVGRWLVTCGMINGDRTCRAVPSGSDYAFVLINHEQEHAREYALFVTDRRATSDGGGNALFQVLPRSPDPAHPALPVLSDYVTAGAAKNGVLTVVLRQDDVDALAGADGFHLVYTRANAASPTLNLTIAGIGDVIGAVVGTMNDCLDVPSGSH